MGKIIDGRALADGVYSEIKLVVEKLGRPPRLSIVTGAPNFATKKYLALKQAKAAAVGLAVNLVELPATASTTEFISAIASLVPQTDAIIVQLPLPTSVDTDAILTAVPETHDADALNQKTRLVWSPVVAACAHILAYEGIDIVDRHVTLIGSGRLVGQPLYQWFTTKGAAVSLVTKDTHDIGYYTRPADILVSGAGVPGLVTPALIKPGVVLLDAGTAEADGELRGDADPACATKASLFTPVPGGIGPLTVAFLLKNVVTLAASRKNH